MYDYQMFIKDIDGTLNYKSFIDDEQIINLLNIGLVKDISKRGDLKHIINTEAIQNVNVKVVRYLDELEHKEMDKKIGFISNYLEL